MVPSNVPPPDGTSGPPPAFATTPASSMRAPTVIAEAGAAQLPGTRSGGLGAGHGDGERYEREREEVPRVDSMVDGQRQHDRAVPCLQRDDAARGAEEKHDANDRIQASQEATTVCRSGRVFYVSSQETPWPLK